MIIDINVVRMGECDQTEIYRGSKPEETLCTGFLKCSVSTNPLQEGITESIGALRRYICLQEARRVRFGEKWRRDVHVVL